MCRYASIQTWLLTLTGCSWTLLFLSVHLPDNHAFRLVNEFVGDHHVRVC